MGRDRDPQLQEGETYLHLFDFKSSFCNNRSRTYTHLTPNIMWCCFAHKMDWKRWKGQYEINHIGTWATGNPRICHAHPPRRSKRLRNVKHHSCLPAISSELDFTERQKRGFINSSVSVWTRTFVTYACRTLGAKRSYWPIRWVADKTLHFPIF